MVSVGVQSLFYLCITASPCLGPEASFALLRTWNEWLDHEYDFIVSFSVCIAASTCLGLQLALWT